jgi:hypothetical protein
MPQILNKIKEVVSDALSAPARSKAKKAMTKASNDVADIKLVREAKGTQDNGDYKDPLFRARANVAQMVAARPGPYGKDYAKMRSSANNR